MKPAQRAAAAMLQLQQDLASIAPRKPGRPGRAPRKTGGPARAVVYLRENQRTELFTQAERMGVAASDVIHDALVACGVISR